MYLFVWSNVLWTPDKLAQKEDVFPGKEENNLPATHSLLTPIDDEKISGAKAGYEDQKKRVEAFYKGLPQVRRALANIATYMIPDDHEVTDDWYLTQQWRHLVLQTGLGRYVFGNGLIAYGLFQGWGNDPKQFERDKNNEFLKQVQGLYPSSPTSPQKTDERLAALHQLLGMVPEPAKTPDDFVQWYYTIDGPEHQIIVLDTRNWRDGRSLYSPPALISKSLLERQIPTTSRPSGKKLTFVVSAVPVLGLPTIEEVLQPGYNLALDIKREWDRQELADEIDDPHTRKLRERELIGAADKDPESWSFDPYAMEYLLERLAGHEQIIFLSGDVHYSLSAELNYWQKTDKGMKPKARFVQLTASAFKNVEQDKRTFVSSPVAQVVFDKLEAPLEKLVWNEAAPAPVKAPEGERLPAHYRLRLQESPVIVGPGGWPAKTIVERLPDRAWRFRLVHDGRSDGERPEAIQHNKSTSDKDPAKEDERVEAYKYALSRHQKALQRRDPRLVLFDSNFGVVSFVEEDTLTLTEIDPGQLAMSLSLSVDEDTIEEFIKKLEELENRPILVTNFRSVIKAHFGLKYGFSTAQLDMLQEKAVRAEKKLTVNHQLYANHSKNRNEAFVYMQHFIGLELTTETSPEVIGKSDSSSAIENRT
jgi:hypothetical protein